MEVWRLFGGWSGECSLALDFIVLPDSSKIEWTPRYSLHELVTMLSKPSYPPSSFTNSPASIVAPWHKVMYIHTPIWFISSGDFFSDIASNDTTSRHVCATCVCVCACCVCARAKFVYSPYFLQTFPPWIGVHRFLSSKMVASSVQDRVYPMSPKGMYAGTLSQFGQIEKSWRQNWRRNAKHSSSRAVPQPHRCSRRCTLAPQVQEPIADIPFDLSPTIFYIPSRLLVLLAVRERRRQEFLIWGTSRTFSSARQYIRRLVCDIKIRKPIVLAVSKSLVPICEWKGGVRSYCVGAQLYRNCTVPCTRHG